MTQESPRQADDGKPQAMSEKCDTCVFRPGDLMRLGPARLRQIVEHNRRVGAVLTCHKTTHGQHPEIGPTACRGFLDAYPDTAAARFADIVFGGWHPVTPPQEDGGEQ